MTSVGLWSRPSTTTGCDRSPRFPGTELAGRVRPATLVQVSCVVSGQRVRNGEPGRPGYYDDDRWLLVVPDDALGLTRPGDAYLANIWYARESLPATVPSC